jgi:beta-glucosidase
VNLALSTRQISQSTLDDRARRVLRFIQQASKAPVSEKESPRNTPEDRALNRKVCGESIVLLKNDSGLLPLKTNVKKVALLGSHMKIPAISGGGSASLLPYYTVSLFDAIHERLAGSSTEISYSVGAYAHKNLPLVNELLLSNPDGSGEGAVMHFFNEPPSASARTSVGSEPLTEIFFQLMDYTQNTKLNYNRFYATIDATFTPDATGIWDFGLTVCGSANVYINDELLIDNSTIQSPGTSFFGKGKEHILCCGVAILIVNHRHRRGIWIKAPPIWSAI